MSVEHFNPELNDKQKSSKNSKHGSADNASDDGIRVMPSQQDLLKKRDDAQFIEEALAQEASRRANLIASSHQNLPNIYVNGEAIDPKQIAQEMQYHPADNKEDAMYLAAQALVVRTLLKQAIFADDTLGKDAWDKDEELAVSQLLDKNVRPKAPDEATMRAYYDKNKDRFVVDTAHTVRHILLAAAPEDDNLRLELKNKADEIIKTLVQSQNRDADFIDLAQRFSACPSKDDGGNLGIITKGSTVSEFEDFLAQHDVGVCINPLSSRYGIHIVEILDKQNGVPLSFEGAKEVIKNQLTQQSFHHALCDFLFSLSNNAKIEGIEMTMNEENVYRGA